MPIARRGDTGNHPADPSKKRSLGEDAVPAPGHDRSALPSDYRTIPGWGVDLDFARRNVFPMELPSEVRTARGDVKHWQVARDTVHMSNEHPGLTPVFGDTLPPSGLSGLLRDYAYEYGEATTRHWMGLMLADRVERIERMATDALKGQPDHFLAERGLRSARRVSMGRTPRRSAVRSGSTAAVVALAIVAGVLMWNNTRD